MNCLLTGSNGFLGRVLESSLSNYTVIHTLSKSSGEYNVNLETQIPIFNQQFDIVIHAAGKAHSIPKSIEDRDAFFSVNVQGTKNLLEGLENYKLPKSFVFISTVAVYGVSEGYLINEQSELNAIDPYGKSKLVAEELVLNWCKTYNIVCTILRLPLLVGSNPPGNLGSMINGLKSGLYFNIAGGKARKSMVLASDVSKYILKASEIGGIFNLTDGYHPSFFELSEILSRQLGKSRSKNLPFLLAKGLALTGDIFGEKAPLNSAKLHKITSDLTFDDSKAREAFGWHPTPVLEGFNISEKT